MLRKQIRMAAVAFKAEAELVELLNRLPNKSAFIRKAIAAQLGAPCPLCNGRGVVSRGIHDHFAPLIQSNRSHPCAGCGDGQFLPNDPGELRLEDRARLEQFSMGGPLYCDACYHAALPCEDCGWHIDQDHLSDHVHFSHAQRGEVEPRKRAENRTIHRRRRSSRGRLD